MESNKPKRPAAGLYDSNFGFSRTLKTQEAVDAFKAQLTEVINTMTEPGFFQVNKRKPEWREEDAKKYEKEVNETTAALIQFVPFSSQPGKENPSPAKVPAAKPAFKSGTTGRVKGSEKF